MKRIALFAATFACALAAAFPAPAMAQDDGAAPGVTAPDGDTVNLVIVYGEDKCPVAADASVITVCPRLPEDDRFRIPEDLRENKSPANQSWASRVESMETVGNFGTLSCSASGYGGWTGCTQALIDAAFEEKRTGTSVKAAQLIAEQRAKRLETIDDDAAAEQARVEVLEKEYDAKLKAEDEAKAKAPAPDTGGQ